ncbi:uncharacterized protein RAG0_17347 [Rhynchosporium agropyri]|uniref:2EXR domain-containing protein n=1 Tax=Rhynchosporium agropyri TaxID=914238 RepID=A0A1E1LTQ6_9HELO|nr:uncharacterized protein RAG0_17347 [Rhynchosporium agropyri]
MACLTTISGAPHEEIAHTEAIPKEETNHCLSTNFSNTGTTTSNYTDATTLQKLQDYLYLTTDDVVKFLVNGPTDVFAISSQLTTSPFEKVWFPLEIFDKYPKLPLELRRLVVSQALPAPAIIVLKHETLFYTSHGQKQRTVRFIPELSMVYTLADLRSSRAMSLMKVNTEFRDVYIKAFPHHIKICQARRERKESKLRYSKYDVLYLSSFFGRIPLDRTFKAIMNTPDPALPFQQITRLAFSGAILARLSDNALNLADFMLTFPALKEIKVLDHDIPAKDGFKKYTNGGSHGANPDPKETAVKMNDNWTAQVDVLINLMKGKPGVTAEQAVVPKITFL